MALTSVLDLVGAVVLIAGVVAVRGRLDSGGRSGDRWCPAVGVLVASGSEGAVSLLRPLRAECPCPMSSTSAPLAA